MEAIIFSGDCLFFLNLPVYCCVHSQAYLVQFSIRLGLMFLVCWPPLCCQAGPGYATS